MIHSTESFIKYFESIRRRTLAYLQVLPSDGLDWSPKPGEFTCGDILRHLAAAEQMFVGTVVEGKWRYPGHQGGPADSLEALLEDLNAVHQQAMVTLATLPDVELDELRPALRGKPVKAWRLLMVMVEHEVHHRSQLAVYLSLMGLQPPQIYGLGVEDILAILGT
jgi:uncharacterized damage-inducible protein DinB